MIRPKQETWSDVLGDTIRGFARVIFSVSAGIYLPGMVIYLLLRLVFGDRFWLLAFFNNFVPFMFLPLLILLPLAIVFRRGWMLKMAVPLACVALLWFAPYFAPRFAAAAQRPIKLVTFNVWQGNQNIQAAVDWLRELNADIVLLQEVLQEHKEGGPLVQLRDLYPYAYDSFQPDAQWGNITLSRFPILSAEMLDNERGRLDVSQQRLEVQIDGQITALYNVHFARPIRPDETPRIRLPFSNYMLLAPLTYDDDLRDRQIRNFLLVVESETLPFIAAGDFNLSDYSQIYGEIAVRMTDAFREAGWGLGTTWPVARAEGRLPGFLPPLVRIDYVWHSAQFRAAEAWGGPNWLGSDHIPLVVTLELVTPVT